MTQSTTPFWVRIVAWTGLVAAVVVVPLGIVYEKLECVCSGVALSIYWAVVQFRRPSLRQRQ